MELNEKSGDHHRNPSDNMKSKSLGITRITTVNNINVHTAFPGYISVWHSDIEPVANMTKKCDKIQFWLLNCSNSPLYLASWDLELNILTGEILVDHLCHEGSERWQYSLFPSLFLSLVVQWKQLSFVAMNTQKTNQQTNKTYWSCSWQLL